MTPIEQLRKMLDDFFFEDEINDIDWAEGFAVKPINWKWTWLTVYVAEKPGQFSLYEATADIHKGIDIEDEKLIKTASLDEMRQEITRIVRENNKSLRLS